MFSKAVIPLGPYRDGPGGMNVPVVRDGQMLVPGASVICVLGQRSRTDFGG